MNGTEWLALRYVCGMVPPGGPEEELLEGLPPEDKQALAVLAASLPEEDPRTAVLRDRGVVRGGLKDASAYIEDPALALVAAALERRLSSVDASAEASPGEDDPDEAIRAMLLSLGWDPDEERLDQEGILQYCRDVFAQARARKLAEREAARG